MRETDFIYNTAQSCHHYDPLRGIYVFIEPKPPDFYQTLLLSIYSPELLYLLEFYCILWQYLADNRSAEVRHIRDELNRKYAGLHKYNTYTDELSTAVYEQYQKLAEKLNDYPFDFDDECKWHRFQLDHPKYERAVQLRAYHHQVYISRLHKSTVRDNSRTFHKKRSKY